MSPHAAIDRMTTYRDTKAAYHDTSLHTINSPLPPLRGHPPQRSQRVCTHPLVSKISDTSSWRKTRFLKFQTRRPQKKIHWHNESLVRLDNKMHWYNKFPSQPRAKIMWENKFPSQPGTKVKWEKEFPNQSSEKMKCLLLWTSFMTLEEKLL